MEDLKIIPEGEITNSSHTPNEKPEEIKNPVGPPKDATEEAEIPEDKVKDMNKTKEIIAQKSNEFFQISEYAISLQQKQLDLVSSLKAKRMSLNSQIRDAYNKLKLNKNYNWRFNGSNAFVGTKKVGPTGTPGLKGSVGMAGPTGPKKVK